MNNDLTECDKKQWESIRRLIDDENPIVRKALITEIARFPEKGKLFLEDLIHNSGDIQAKHAHSLIAELGWGDGVGDFLSFIRSQRYELESGWFLLDRTIFPTFEISSASLFLDQLADRVRELLMPPQNAREICSVLNRVFFHEFGFRGATKDFSDPRNSFIHLVLERKRGLPITLCVVYLLIARRVGLELEPIGLPGRFMLGSFTGKEPFYIDVWSGGKFFDIDQMEDFLDDFETENSGASLLPVTVAETLARGCRNLVQQFAKAGECANSNLFQKFVTEFEEVYRREASA
jgi:regulator of sirC expression with transglutaminase-like and TPR domain